MKLLTHNMLECHIKGVTNKYPFKVEVQQLETCESDFNPGRQCLFDKGDPPFALFDFLASNPSPPYAMSCPLPEVLRA